MNHNVDINIPPKEGEYGYFDAKLSKNNLQVLKSKRTHWLIKINNDEDSYVGCHYSSKDEINDENIKIHGIIKEVKK